MGLHWDVWIHGSSIQVEYPELTESIRHRGWGTDVQQKPKSNGEDSENWFHFAIPSFTRMAGSHPVDHLDCWLKAKLNSSAEITQIDVWDGNDKIIPKKVSLRGPDVDYYLNLSDEKTNLGIGISVKVKFEKGPEPGLVSFIGAAIRFRN